MNHLKNSDNFFLKFWGRSGAKVCKSCKSRHELSHDYQYLFAKNLDKKFGDGTANELHLKSQMLTKFTNDELLEKIKLYTKLVKEL